MSDAAVVDPPVVVPPVVTPPVVTPPVDPNQAAIDAAAAEAAKPPVAPVVPPAEVLYALTLPKDAVIEAGAVERITAFAKAHSLSPAAAQKALEHANAEVVADRAKHAEANTAAFQTLARETWVNEIKADKDFGGEKFDATVLESKRAADRFITPEEQKILKETGWGNHPLLVKMFARVGRAMSNDALILGGPGGPDLSNSEQARADRIYDKTAQA